MDGSLPSSLKHVISNAEYYGPSLFLLGKWNVSLKVNWGHIYIYFGVIFIVYNPDYIYNPDLNYLEFRMQVVPST